MSHWIGEGKHSADTVCNCTLGGAKIKPTYEAASAVAYAFMNLPSRSAAGCRAYFLANSDYMSFAGAEIFVREHACMRTKIIMGRFFY